MGALVGYPAGPKSLGGTTTPGAAPDVEPRMSSAVSRAGPWLSALRLSPLSVVVGAGRRTLTGMGRPPLAAGRCWALASPGRPAPSAARVPRPQPRSEEHTSELQSRQYLVCR